MDYLPDLETSGDIRDAAISAKMKCWRPKGIEDSRRRSKTLSPAQRDCLALRTRGLKYREIGEVLNLSVSTVGENVQRGLEKLKELL